MPTVCLTSSATHRSDWWLFPWRGTAAKRPPPKESRNGPQNNQQTEKGRSESISGWLLTSLFFICWNGAPGRIRTSGLLIRSPCEWGLHGNALRRTKSQISSIHKGSIRFCLSHCVARRCTEFPSQQPPEQPPENILIRAPFSGPACRRASRGTTVRNPGRTHFRLRSPPSSLSERMNSRGFKR